MALKHLHNIWVRQQQCPCGDWKCYIKYEGDDPSMVASQLLNSDLPDSSPPEVVFTPYVGRIFESDDEAFEYYSTFARKNGFSIRKARSTESQNLGIYRRDFVCYRSGFNQPRKKANVEHPRDRKSLRCGCDAKLYLTKETVDGLPQWYISQFSNVHNHELLEDDQVHLLPAYRKIEEADQERILLLSKAGFPINQILKVLELGKVVQPGQLPFIEKDVRNFVRSCKETAQEDDTVLSMKVDDDLLELLGACRAATEGDDEFVYDFTTDRNGKVENIAWTYSNSIQAFSLFGDVVTIDTSYQSIAYSTILAMWFGIDNHGYPIFLGALYFKMRHAFARFMRERRPEIVITDVDPALRDALAVEMPNTKQIISIWKIISKVPSWFSLQFIVKYSDFRSEFDTLCHLENVEDFEHQWNNLVTRFGIGSDKHISLIFSYRSSWPLCYIRNFFFARTMIQEYSKSIETFLRNILSVQSLQSFFKQVSIAAISCTRKSEKLLYLPTKTCLPLEEHALSILIPFAFRALQHEIVLSMQYAITEMSNGSYLVRHYKKMEKQRLVIWIPDDEQVHCSCKEFEHSGTLCRHSLRVLVVKNYFEIPYPSK